MSEITIPNDWTPRDYQTDLYNRFGHGREFQRAISVWHRRSGKDSTSLNITAREMLTRVGTYWHLFPEHAQARRSIWDGVDSRGRKILDQIFPPAIRARTSRQDMTIELVNGSVWQMAGSDRYDSLMGATVVSVALSEWSLMDPRAWDYIRPILMENNGLAMFLYTPRGRNHGLTLLDRAQAQPDRWLTSILTVDDTRRADGSPVISQDAIAREREDGMTEQMVQQEFYCSFNAPQSGAIYGAEMQAARSEHRISSIPVEPLIPVHTIWDWGWADDTAIWLVQIVGKERRLVGYHSDSGKTIEDYLIWLTNFRAARPGLEWGKHIGPHDTDTHSMQTGKTNGQIAAELGYKFEVVPRTSDKALSINALRRIFKTLWFDRDHCADGIAAVEAYRYEWDPKNMVHRSKPKHDWASNGADALQQLGLYIESLEPPAKRKTVDPPRAMWEQSGSGSWMG